MRILLANKFYYRRGGDCVYVLNLEQLLRSHGHDVAVFAMDYPQNIDTPWKKYFPSEMIMKPGLNMLESLRRPLGTKEVRRKFTALLSDFNPDVVHLNNIHTQLSPVIAEIAHAKGCRVVWTLHDYKLLCPRYDCLQNGQKICEECFTDKHMVLEHRCMKNSWLASVIAYKEAVKWSRERLEASTDIFICPSRFMYQKMVKGGFDSKKLETLCNFIDVDKCRKADYEKDDYYCFLGRLSAEKGIETLVKAANELPYKLIVIGGGPLGGQMRAIGKENIEFVGMKQWDEIKNLVGQARFSVIPSEWYENNPLSVIEAQCLGTPMLGARIGGIPELIEEGVNGTTFESGNVEDLKLQIEKMWDASFDYRQIAERAQKQYSEETYYNRLMELYK